MSISWSRPQQNGGFALLSYKIYSNNALVATVQPNLLSYQLTGLTSGSSYKLEVSSVNEVGESAHSDSNTILFANVPSTPASLTLTSTAKPDLTATWTGPSSINGDAVRGYKLYIDDGEGGDFSLVYDGTGFANIYTYTIGQDLV